MQEIHRVIEETVEFGERRNVNGVVGVDGQGQLWKRAEAQVDGLDAIIPVSYELAWPGLEARRHTPLTILVPTLVMWPFTISFLGVLSTSVLPGSIGASSA